MFSIIISRIYVFITKSSSLVYERLFTSIALSKNSIPYYGHQPFIKVCMSMTPFRFDEILAKFYVYDVHHTRGIES